MEPVVSEAVSLEGQSFLMGSQMLQMAMLDAKVNDENEEVYCNNN